jgi:hypothetical protein
MNRWLNPPLLIKNEESLDKKSIKEISFARIKKQLEKTELGSSAYAAPPKN